MATDVAADEILNELLVKLFKDIMEIEGKWLVTEEFDDITYNDFHIIEAVGKEAPKSMKQVAQLMGVTTGTLTKAVDALEEKSYVTRERNAKDKRVVWISLTSKGKKAFEHHAGFHREMIEKIKSGLNEKELPHLIYTLAKVVDFFQEVQEAGFRNA